MPPADPNRQTVAAGTPVAQRYARRLSSPISNTAPDPGTGFFMFVGKPGCGKTHLPLTNPDCFLINADRSQLPILPDVRAQVWPTKDADGQLLDVGGAPFNMRWEELETMVTVLCEMADANEARPRTIVLDTIAGLMNLGIDKIVRDSDRNTWKELDGRWAWDSLYTMIVDMADRLRSHGYGTGLTCHLLDKVLDLPGSEGQQKISSLTITGNFWSRIFWKLDFCGVIVQETVIQNVERVQRAGGRERRVTIPEETEQRILTVSRNEYVGIAKTRVALPEVTLSRADSWSDFQTAYMAASAQQQT